MQSSKHEDRKQPSEFFIEKPDKKDRLLKPKEKREKLTEEEKEQRKERKLVRKRVSVFSEICVFDLLLI